MSRLIEQQNVAMNIKSTTLSTYGNNIDNSPPTSVTTETTQQQTDKLQRVKALASRNEDGTNVQKVLISLCSGATAGALAKSVIAPLDRAKINFQINKELRYSFKAALQFMQNTYHENGLLALWKGNSATMARIIPYAAIHFTAHEQWRKVLQVDKNGSDTKLRRFIAGSLAGITGQSLTYPLDFARARMTVTDRKAYQTLRGVFVKVWTEEGPRALFRGYWPTVIGVIPYAGTSFFTYGTLKREYTILTGEKKPNTLLSLAFGAVAGAAGQTASYPLDIVRRRMQTMYLEKGTKTPSAIKMLIKIYRDEGIRHGFYKGLTMNWIKGPIAVGISFSTYDIVQDFLYELFHVPKDKYSPPH